MRIQSECQVHSSYRNYSFRCSLYRVRDFHQFLTLNHKVTNPSEIKLAPPIIFAACIGSDVESPSYNSAAPTTRKRNARKGAIVSGNVSSRPGKGCPIANCLPRSERQEPWKSLRAAPAV